MQAYRGYESNQLYRYLKVYQLEFYPNVSSGRRLSEVCSRDASRNWATVARSQRRSCVKDSLDILELPVHLTCFVKQSVFFIRFIKTQVRRTSRDVSALLTSLSCNRKVLIFLGNKLWRTQWTKLNGRFCVHNYRWSEVQAEKGLCGLMPRYSHIRGWQFVQIVLSGACP